MYTLFYRCNIAQTIKYFKSSALHDFMFNILRTEQTSFNTNYSFETEHTAKQRILTKIITVTDRWALQLMTLLTPSSNSLGY